MCESIREEATIDTNQLLGDFGRLKKNIDSAVKLLKEISRLEQDRMANLPRLRARLTKVDEITKQLGQAAEQREALRNWVDMYGRELAISEEEMKKQFGARLEQELRKRGLSLSGQYPELKSGLFTLAIDWAKGRVVLWYGPKQERLDQCGLSAEEVANRVEKARQRLGAQLSEEEFLERLYEAYGRAANGSHGERLPITEVLGELAYLLQSARFRRDPRRENYRSYSRASFSYDLFRARQFESPTILHNRLHLVVATRASTRQRQDFLWVPDDESGRGTAYSHLQFKPAIE